MDFDLLLTFDLIIISCLGKSRDVEINGNVVTSKKGWAYCLLDCKLVPGSGQEVQWNLVWRTGRWNVGYGITTFPFQNDPKDGVVKFKEETIMVWENGYTYGGRTGKRRSNVKWGTNDKMTMTFNPSQRTFSMQKVCFNS